MRSIGNLLWFILDGIWMGKTVVAKEVAEAARKAKEEATAAASRRDT